MEINLNITADAAKILLNKVSLGELIVKVLETSKELDGVIMAMKELYGEKYASALHQMCAEDIMLYLNVRENRIKAQNLNGTYASYCVPCEFEMLRFKYDFDRAENAEFKVREDNSGKAAHILRFKVNNLAFFADAYNALWNEGMMGSEDLDLDEQSGVVGYYITHYGKDAYKKWCKTPCAGLYSVSFIERCLKYLSGLSDNKDSRAFEFKDAKELYDFVINGNDLYNPLTRLYAFSYSEQGDICVYENITIKKARELSSDMKKAGENGWSAFLGTERNSIYGGDEPFDNAGMSEVMAWCTEHYADKGWVRADDETFSKENEKYIVKGYDLKPTKWIVSKYTAGNDLIENRIVVGRTQDVKEHILALMKNEREIFVPFDVNENVVHLPLTIDVMPDGSLRAAKKNGAGCAIYVARVLSDVDITELVLL